MAGGRERSKACSNVQAVGPGLERTLQTLGVVPARSGSSVEERQAALGEGRERLMDTTEREPVRPQDAQAHRTPSRGKKRPTVKQTVSATCRKGMLCLSDPGAGSIHEDPQGQEEVSVAAPPDDRVTWGEAFGWWRDVGSWGTHKTSAATASHRPPHTPRKSQRPPSPALTEEQPTENRAIRRVRVRGEQAIRGLKRGQIVPHRFRNRLEGIVDAAALLAAGRGNWTLHGQGITH